MKTHPIPLEADSLAVQIPAGEALLDGELIQPPDARGLVVFAHGSGSSRHSPRNQYAARIMHLHAHPEAAD